MAKGKTHSRKNTWEGSKVGKPPHGNPQYAIPQQGMTPLNVEARIKCHYCGKFGRYSKDCFKRKYHESKHRYRTQTNDFADRGEAMNDGFKKH